MNRKLKFTLRMIAVFIGIAIASVGYFSPAKKFDQTPVVIYSILGVVFGIIAFLLISFLSDRMKDAKEKKKEKERKKRYLAKRISTKDFIGKLRIELSKTESINLLMCPRAMAELAFAPSMYKVFWGLNATSAKNELVNETTKDFFKKAIAAAKENGLPTLLFVHFGIDSVALGIPAFLQEFKTQIPSVRIFFFCSEQYSQKKANAIYDLMDDGIVRKYTISDSIFIDQARLNKSIEQIQSSLVF